MKSIVIISILLIATAGFSAPVENVVSSALMPGDSVIYNLDFLDPFGLPFFDVSINSRVGNSSSDQNTVLSHIPDSPFYINTYEGTANYQNPTDDIEYYGRVEADTLVVTQAYKNTGNQFPPSEILYADLADDPVGDTTAGTPGQWLDLTGSSVTYSDDRIYAKLKNAGGGWPTNEGLTFFAYAFFIYNPDNPTLTATAMVYVNVPFFFTSGLYSVNLEDTSFTQISSIDTQTDGNFLHLSCSVSDLLSDPNWNTWPPESGYAITGGMTLAVISLQPTLADFTYPSAFIPETQYLSVNSNTTPNDLVPTFLLDPPFSLGAGAMYNDADNNLPVEKTLFFDGDYYTLESSDHTYFDNSIFEHMLPWPGAGWHTFYFLFSDGAATVQTPFDSFYIEPVSVPEDQLPTQFTLSQNYPNPFNAQTSIEFETSDYSTVTLTIFDINGRIVNRLIDNFMQPGNHSIVWNGKEKSGDIVSSGVYYYMLKTDNNTAVKKMILLK